MKKQLSIVGMVFVLLFAGFSGCLKGEIIFLTIEDDKSNVHVNTGGKIIITLEENPSAGYSWNITELNESILYLTKQFTWEHNGLVGAPIKHTWVFTAGNNGTTILKLAYYRPWEGIENATMNFTVNVE